MARIAMFGGSFNPIHNGHLHILQVCRDAMDLDQVFLIPSQQPVHKVSHDMAPGYHRAQMCRLAAARLPWCTVDEMELQRSEKSYTVLSLRTLRCRFPEDELYLLIGSDMLTIFREWYCFGEILSLAHVCCVQRENEPMDSKTLQVLDSLSGIGHPVTVIPCEPVVCSSTQIRERLRRHLPIDDLVPKAVAQYIEKEGLYRL